MQRLGGQFLARARFTQQQHRGICRPGPFEQFQHVQKRRGIAHHAQGGRRHPFAAEKAHRLDEERCFACGVAQGEQFDFDELLAAGRVMAMEHPA